MSGLPHLQNRGFQNWFLSYKMQVSFFIYKRDLLLFHNEIEDELIKAIRQESDALSPLKLSYTVLVDLKKDTNRGEEHVEYFSRQGIPILLNAFNPRTVKEMLNVEINKKGEVVAGWVERGSRWTIDRIKTVYIDFARYDPIRGGTHIPLPPKLKAKNAIINVKNKDSRCLRWALRAARFPVARGPQRPSKYPTEDSFDFTGISFPTPLHKYRRLRSLTTLPSMFLAGKTEK